MRLVPVLLAVVFLISLLPAPSLGQEQERWPKGPDEVRVSLSVLYALEEGPIVCKVNLKNVSQQTLTHYTDRFSYGAHCELLVGWQWKVARPVLGYSIIGNPGPYPHTLQPGESESKTFYLHHPFRSIRPGNAPTHFSWNLYGVTKAKNEERLSFRDQYLHHLFALQDLQPVSIQPATRDNVGLVVQNLEATLIQATKQLEGQGDSLGWRLDPSRDFVQTITGCRHKEFVPLLLRGVDELPFKYPKRDLIATVYESFPSPEEGFGALLDYLSRSHAAGAGDVFAYWVGHDKEHKDSKRRQEELKKPRPKEPDLKDLTKDEALWAMLSGSMREMEEQEEAAWQTSRRHLDTRLTAEQFGRLRAMPNVWVRALLYSHYPAQCPAAWVDTFLKDLSQTVQPPRHLERWLAELDDDRFAVRERATSDLVAVGPGIAPKLRAVLKEGKRSPEAQSRINKILQRVEAAGLPHLVRRTLTHLAAEPKPQDRRMLDVLLASDFPNLINQKARKLEAARQKAEEEQRARDAERQRWQKDRTERLRAVVRQKKEFKIQSNPPPVSIRRFILGTLIHKVDPQDRMKVVISAGSDQGLAAGHTLEVYRLQPQPLYLGLIRIEQVEHRSATARRVGAQASTQVLQEGDEVVPELRTDD